MRFLVAVLVLFAAFVGYGTYRQRQVTLAQRERAAALQDSLRRADSLQKAEADAAAAAQRAAQLAQRQRHSEAHRRRQAEQLEIMESDALKRRKLRKPQRRVVIIDKPVRTNRRR